VNYAEKVRSGRKSPTSTSNKRARQKESKKAPKVEEKKVEGGWVYQRERERERQSIISIMTVTAISKVGIPIAIFLRRGAELSDKIVEVIKKNTRFQYELSGAERSGAIFIAWIKSDSYCKSQR
jgi:hypothetical protein